MPPPVRLRSHEPARRIGRQGTSAIVASLAMHAFIAWLILRGAVPSARRPDDEPLSFDIVRATEVEPSRSTVPSDSIVPSAPAVPARSRTRIERRPDPTAPPPVDDSPGPMPPNESRSGGHRSGATSLLPSADQLARAGVLLTPPPDSPQGATGPAGRAGPSRWQRDLGAVQRREAGRAAVAAGRAPPEAFDLLRDMEKIYAPSQELVIALAKKHAGGPRNLDRWLGRYLRGFGEKPATPAGQPFDPTAAFNRAIVSAGLDTVARVCAILRPGMDPVIEIDVSSGIAAFDTIAVRTVSRAALRRVDQVPRTRVCYRFSAKLTRIPPVPILGCFLTTKGPECVYPFKEIASTRVTLDGVEPLEEP